MTDPANATIYTICAYAFVIIAIIVIMKLLSSRRRKSTDDDTYPDLTSTTPATRSDFVIDTRNSAGGLYACNRLDYLSNINVRCDDAPPLYSRTVPPTHTFVRNADDDNNQIDISDQDSIPLAELVPSAVIHHATTH